MSRPQLDQTALHGIAGEFVRMVEPHTEADPAALLITFLAGAGNAIGHGPHVRVGADQHHAKVWAVLVGGTSTGRKGTSLGWVKAALRMADAGWADRIVNNVGSGEVLIWKVRDATPDPKGKNDDPGEPDKRLFIAESEFAGLLRVAGRDASVLSPILRQCWEESTLTHTVKREPARATKAHITVVGHVTRDELRKTMRDTERTGGTANRFLWARSERSRLLPDGGNLHPDDLAPLAQRLARSLQRAREIGEVRRTDLFREQWKIAYEELSAPHPGALGAVLVRGAPHVMRLALVFAVLDGDDLLGLPHLRAALAVWRYTVESAKWVFGTSTGDRDADRIVLALQEHPEGLPRKAITQLLGNRNPGDALELLAELGMITVTKHPGPVGRPKELVRLTSHELTEQTPISSVGSDLHQRAHLSVVSNDDLEGDPGPDRGDWWESTAVEAGE